MRDQGDLILNLKKIRVLISPESHLSDCNIVPEQMDFIFGIGQEGLTPFEYELSRRRQGETFKVSLKKDALKEFFGHLYPALTALPEGEDEVRIHITFQGYEDASPREIIKAMAEIAECGDHCCSC